MSKPREFDLPVSEESGCWGIAKFGMADETIRVIEKSAYDKLLDDYCILKAREINNSPLRGYDGLADELTAEKKRSARLEEKCKQQEIALHKILRINKRIHHSIVHCFNMVGEGTDGV